LSSFAVGLSPFIRVPFFFRRQTDGCFLIALRVRSLLYTTQQTVVNNELTRTTHLWPFGRLKQATSLHLYSTDMPLS
jgi:hypothetical protein